MRKAIASMFVLCAPLAFPQPALASSTLVSRISVDASAWSWRHMVAAGEPSNVPAGDLAVQFDGRPSAPPAKATYLRLDLSQVPPQSHVDSFTLVLPLDTKATADPATNASTSPIVACPVAAPFVAGAGVDPTLEPAEDCEHSVAGVYDGVGKTFAFSLSELAQGWLDGTPNNGIVVRPAPSAVFPFVTPFQLTFLGPQAISGRLEVTLPEATPSPAVVVTPAASPSLPPDRPGIALGPVLVPAPATASGPVPVTVPSPAQVQPIQPVAFAPRISGTRALSWASQAGLAAFATAGLLLLLLVGWSVGDGMSPRQFALAERRRRDQQLPAALVAVQPRQMRQARKPSSSAASTLT